MYLKKNYTMYFLRIYHVICRRLLVLCVYCINHFQFFSIFSKANVTKIYTLLMYDFINFSKQLNKPENENSLYQSEIS